MRQGLIAGVFAACALALPSAAAAIEACPGSLPEPNYLVTGQTTLESVIVDDRGRLFFTNADRVLRLDGRNVAPVKLADIVEPGGLAFDSDGKLVVGTGNTIPNGVVGNVAGQSGLIKVDPDTGETSTYATGLSMGNGLVRGLDGSFYASDDGGVNIDRITDGRTEPGWAKVISGNGLVIDSSGQHLYAAETFRPAAIARVPLADPGAANTEWMLAANPLDWPAGLDGLAIDGADNIFAAANGSGAVWKVAINGDGSAGTPCTVLSGLPGFPDGPSAVAVGVGDGPFGAGNLYVVTFDGNVIELPGVAVP